MRRSAVLTIAVLVALIAGPGVEVRGDSSDTHFVWRASSDSGGVVWLVGSMHALPKSALPLPEVVDRAFDEAEMLVLEVDLAELDSAAMAMLSAGSLPPDERLPDVLCETTRGALEDYLSEAGLSMSSFEVMRPWMVALTLTQLQLTKRGFDAEAGLDHVLYRRATERGLPVSGLERAADQIELFSSMTPEEEDAFLHSSLVELETLETELDRLVTAWQTGDVDTVLDLTSQGLAEHPKLYRRLVDDRNEAWLPQVRSLLEGERIALVAVGALHLVGESGLVERLRGEGYTVVQH